MTTPLADHTTWTIECPCCGDDAAFGKGDEEVFDGQTLACGCKGHLSVDADDTSVFADECECGR